MITESPSTYPILVHFHILCYQIYIYSCWQKWQWNEGVNLSSIRFIWTELLSLWTTCIAALESSSVSILLLPGSIINWKVMLLENMLPPCGDQQRQDHASFVFINQPFLPILIAAIFILSQGQAGYTLYSGQNLVPVILSNFLSLFQAPALPWPHHSVHGHNDIMILLLLEIFASYKLYSRLHFALQLVQQCFTSRAFQPIHSNYVAQNLRHSGTCKRRRSIICVCSFSSVWNISIFKLLRLTFIGYKKKYLYLFSLLSYINPQKESSI